MHYLNPNCFKAMSFFNIHLTLFNILGFLCPLKTLTTGGILLLVVLIVSFVINKRLLFIIIIIISIITVFAGVLFVHQPGANHAPRASVTQVNHSVHTLRTFLRIRADPSMQIV